MMASSQLIWTWTVRGSCNIQISNHLSPIFLANPKRQRGRKAQQARAAASVAATPSTAVATGATATVTNTTVTAATTVTNPYTTVTAAATTTTATAAPSMPTVAAAGSAVISTTVNLIDEENPFIESTHNQSSQLEDRMHTLVIRSSQSSSVGKDSSTSKSLEVGAPNQKNRKEAQDMNKFFLAENGWWYCKFCKYIFYFYLQSVSLSNA